MELQPYWESAEDSFIIHYTKSVVTAFGDDEGWDAEIGLKTEIVPLSKPFGLHAGNVFQGIVKLNGKPVPFAEVEVEYYNIDQKLAAPTNYMITQTIKADGNGVFTYAAPTINNVKQVANHQLTAIRRGSGFQPRSIRLSASAIRCKDTGCLVSINLTG